MNFLCFWKDADPGFAEVEDAKNRQGRLKSQIPRSPGFPGLKKDAGRVRLREHFSFSTTSVNISVDIWEIYFWFIRLSCG